MSNSFNLSKWVVEMNARGQAKADVDAMDDERVKQILEDQTVLLDVSRVLGEWANSRASIAVFRGLDKEVYDSLTELQKSDLVTLWTSLYPAIIYDLLRKRVEHE